MAGFPDTPRPAAGGLQLLECLYYRDRLREARYAALADAEGFGAICFALEALGLRLLGRQEALGAYKGEIGIQARSSLVLNELADAYPLMFKPFNALFSIVQAARNDVMHTGAYARHATQAAIELCIGVEEALMAEVTRTVSNLMVSAPVTVEAWQPVAHARQLMLMHSFSFLPVRLDGTWCLVSELGLAKYLNDGVRKTRLAETIEAARSNGMEVIEVAAGELLGAQTPVEEVLQRAQVQRGPMLWLVVDQDHQERLAGVLSPFELM